MPDLVVLNAGELVTCIGEGLGIVEDGALVAESGKVVWVGTTKDFRRKSLGKGRRVVDAQGGLVTPGFIDPHSHLLFAGSREDEVERKLSGESYLEILRKGGGIARTIRETRRATVERLVEESLGRAMQLLRNGVTTLEVKTGYGQSAKGELKMLDAIESLRRRQKIELVPTFLGLHAVPPEFHDSGSYVDHAVKEILPAVAARQSPPMFSDCFCEDGVFSRDECRRYLRASSKLGLGLKIHADEFAESGGASLAAELGCVSADHLAMASHEGIDRMGKKGITAVLLPGTALNSGIPFVDARKVREAGCEVALGTDLSPNSWIESPQMVMALATAGMKMTPAQALLGFTRSAAKAIGRTDIGSLRVGSRADLVVHSIPGHRFLPYRVGGSYVRNVFRGGKQIFTTAS